MKRFLRITVITCLFVACFAYTARASTADMLVERTVEQLPAPKGPISVDDPIWLKAIEAILGSNLEPTQKNALVEKLITGQFEAKSSFWKGAMDWAIRLISVGAGIYTAIKIK